MSFIKKIVGSALEISTKVLFSLDKYQIKIWVENPVSAIQHIGKAFLKCFLPVTKLVILHTVIVLHYIHHIKWHDWLEGEGCQNAKKTIYYKSSLVAYFVQMCSFISIYNGVYTVCSYDTPQ